MSNPAWLQDGREPHGKTCRFCALWDGRNCAHPRHRNSDPGRPCPLYRYRNAEPVAGGSRRCPRCRRTLPDHEFRTKQGASSHRICRRCRNLATRESMERRRERKEDGD